ncbi:MULTISPECIES: GGDEF domain-containing protein [Paenibacillus]|uniref:GGDEF domain-containing protein n=1 Tax=Paenibacillus TaxID=44249 RepID=UPI0022B8B9BE|nr:GGDEF domain-containing protein [Paenibacillus caseinilyticus]MCZ8523970.1 GGDEF domain-containing protein [Paenibacillus caseinilyticus]
MAEQPAWKEPGSHRWNRTILTIFWITLAVIFLCQLLNFMMVRAVQADYPLPDYFHRYVLYPDLILALLGAAAECFHAMRSRYTEIAILTVVHAAAIVLIQFISVKIHAAPAVMIFPVLATMLYLKRSFMIGSALVTGLYFAVHLFLLPQGEIAQYTSIIMITGLLIAAVLTGLAIIRRGTEILLHLQSVIQSEQELRVQNMLMDHISRIDALTGLFNHKTYHEKIESLIRQAEQEGSVFQLAVLDIDNFKKVNDTYGHWVGDIALKHAAGILKERLGPEDFAARYGGEEFVLLLMAQSPLAAYEKVEAVRAAVAVSPIPEMDGLPVTLSVGLHEYVPGETRTEVFRQADAALYEAKKAGKNRTITR